MDHRIARYLYLIVQLGGLAACVSPIGPLIGLIIIVIGGIGYRRETKAIKEEQRLVDCPHCAEKIKPEAKLCKHCHKEL